jgi:hypothetical protein
VVGGQWSETNLQLSMNCHSPTLAASGDLAIVDWLKADR